MTETPSGEKTPPGPATGTEFEDPEKPPNPWGLVHEPPPAHQRPDNLDPHIGPWLDEITDDLRKAAADVGNS